MKAFVEIKVEAGANIERIIQLLRSTEGVREAFAVTGHTDIIASIEASDLKGVADIVTQKIHAIKGIENTETMVCVED
ncbi:MAG: Lrp/AsnC ligand binding domain-containing protein [Candidatus Nitrosocaldus sp.]